METVICVHVLAGSVAYMLVFNYMRPFPNGFPVLIRLPSSWKLMSFMKQSGLRTDDSIPVQMQMHVAAPATNDHDRQAGSCLARSCPMPPPPPPSLPERARR